jgi:alkylation response protein AidB-like acyl-CoA dehydrogenase
MSQPQNRYKADLRELEFLLFEQFKMGDLLSKEPFQNWGPDEVKMVLEGSYEFATTVLGPLNAVGDREGCRIENGRVITPTGFKDAWKKLHEAGWRRLSESEELGGQGAPHTLQAIVEELFSGANCAFMMYPGLAIGAAHLIDAFGTPELKKLYAARMHAGQWGGTMCLTEPHAGSRRGLGEHAPPSARRTMAPTRIKGTKIFISGGDHDCAENIVHLVLARIEGAERAPRASRSSWCPQVPRERRRQRSVSATTSRSRASSTRWASTARRPASCSSARTTSASAGSAATPSTRACARCSR